MSWNYRVVRSHGTHPSGKPWECYAIHGVYYDPEGAGGVEGITEDPSPAREDTLEGLREVLQMMTAALDHPIMEEGS